MSAQSLKDVIIGFLNKKASISIETKKAQNIELNDDFELELVEKWKPILIENKINFGAKFLLEKHKVLEIIDISINDFIVEHKKKREQIEKKKEELKINEIRKGFVTIDEMLYYELLTNITNSYKTEFGERKFEKVVSEVLNSKTIQKLLIEFQNKNKPINPADVLYVLNTISYFLFSRGQTATIGAILTIQLWNERANQGYKILSPNELRERIEFVLRKNSSMNF
jgi:hypothetical protein